LTRKITVALAISAALLGLSLPSAASGPGGAIRGRVVDDKGAPLSGAYLYVSTPTALGLANYITSKSGRYAVVGLTPGTYKVVVEMPGFKTVTVDGVVLSSGATATLDFRMEPTDIEEEPTTASPGPTLDEHSSRSAVVLDRELIARLPLPRDFTAVLGLVPGLVFDDDTPGMRASLYGAPVTSNILVEDGVVVTHPVDARAMGRINTEIIEEVIVETAGHAAEAGPVQGAYINIVGRPGSGSFEGDFAYSASGRGLVDSLWTDEEIAEMDGAEATSLRREHDLSLSIGGPVLDDMVWLFANFRYRTMGRRAPFRYWTDPLGVRHFVYDYAERDFSGLFKLSMDILGKFKGVLELGFSGVREPVFEPDLELLRPEASTRELDGEGVKLARAGGAYVVNQSTRVDLSVGYAKYKQPLFLNDAATYKPEYYDIITGHSWGSYLLNDREIANRTRAGVSVTRLQDRFLGMYHEVVAGGEYETTSTSSSTWKSDNLILNYADGSPYTYGLTLSPVSGNDVGWGLIGFYIAPENEGGMSVKRELKRIGVFLQDTMTVGGRLSLSAGLRFDRSEARFPAVSKGASGNGVSGWLGGALIDPVMGLNLYDSVSFAPWEKAIVWNTLSPRFGLSFDLIGNGRTVLKGSWARLPEYLGLGYSQDLAQIDPLTSHDFFWYDEDGDGLVDYDDSYTLLPYDFRVYKGDYFRQAVDPDLSAPVIEEWTAALEQQVGRDLTLAARYIVREHTNNIGHIVYDPSTEVSWWRVEDSPEGWWVPFSTVVPGAEGYDDVPLTVYFPSTTAPTYFERIENVPELTAKYRSLEFSFRKRMSHNWQLFGSLVWNRATGTTGLASRWSAGNSPVLLTPNSFINIAATDRLLQDRPFVARLAGTVRFGWDIFASFLLKAQSGSPWARTVTIMPPSDWAAANGATVTPVTVYLESPGSRRFDSWKNLDFRLEKEFTKSGQRGFSVSVDVLNLLGDKYRTLDLNDSGTWAPDGEGDAMGTRILSGTYGEYWPLWATRVVRLNLSLKF
jgi:hypothetical protein